MSWVSLPRFLKIVKRVQGGVAEKRTLLTDVNPRHWSVVRSGYSAPMQRRQFNQRIGVWMAALGGLNALPAGAQNLSSADALGGIRAALSTGAKVAVQQLGRQGGFSGNAKVRIGLPGVLEDAAPLLRGMGQGKRLDELVAAMNQAAEQAVPLAADLLANAIQHLSVDDALHIVRGGDTAVTDFFADKTREPLTAQFLPVVRQHTQNVKLADKYQAVAGRAAKMGLIKAQDADLPGYVTGRALDGLYLVIGEEERKIRQNPAAAGSALLRKVFGG